jgi:hypothetical protein
VSEKVPTISKERLCELTGLSDRRHRQIAELGFFPPPIRSQYQEVKTLEGMLRYALQELRKKDDTLKQEEKLLKKAKREMAEEELSVIRKKYVLKDAICPALKNLSMHQKATLKQKFENEIAPKLEGKKTVEILALIRNGVDAVARVFAEGTKAWMDKE